MSRGWWIYAAVLTAVTVLAVGGSDTGATGLDVLIAVVGNFLVLVLLPRAIQLGWRKMRHREA